MLLCRYHCFLHLQMRKLRHREVYIIFSRSHGQQEVIPRYSLAPETVSFNLLLCILSLYIYCIVAVDLVPYFNFSLDTIFVRSIHISVYFSKLLLLHSIVYINYILLETAKIFPTFCFYKQYYNKCSAKFYFQPICMFECEVDLGRAIYTC